VPAPLAARAAEKAPKAPAGPITSTLCDAACAERINGTGKVTLPSGLEYQDIVAGRGASPVTGYQVTVNYVAMTPDGRVFDDSLAKGAAYDIRCATGTGCCQSLRLREPAVLATCAAMCKHGCEERGGGGLRSRLQCLRTCMCAATAQVTTYGHARTAVATAHAQHTGTAWGQSSRASTRASRA
jgi:hypothetical protein